MSSATVIIHSLALEKQANGEKVYNFAAGEPVLSCPEITDAISQRMRTDSIIYTPVAGLTDLRKAAVEWMADSYNAHYSVEQTLVTAGGKFALFTAIQAVIKPGDEVLIPTPHWVSYSQITKLFQGIPVFLPTSPQNSWKLTVETLKKHATKKSKILILNQASNPTGALYTKEELKALLETANQLGLLIIADEVYSELVYDAHAFVSCGSFKKWKRRILVIQSLSKNCGMTGWRIGFAFGPKTWIETMKAIQSQSTSSPSIVSQWAAIEALKHRTSIFQNLRETMQKRRDLFFDTFYDIFKIVLTKPASALYAFIPLSIFNTQKNSSEFCTELLNTANIACVPGISFGQEGYIRMAFTEKEEVLKEGLFALKEAIK